MYIWWGAELFCFYNDAYRQSIGPELHPSSLGRPGREVWSEIWDIIGPQIDQVMRGGGATWHVNALVPITRFGKREDVYWTYSYSPIDDAAALNSVGGVLVVCTETTRTVLAEQRRAEEADRQRRLFEQAPGFIIIMRGTNHVVEFVNDAHKQLFGSENWTGRPIAEAFPSIAGQGFFQLLDRVYVTGETYHADAVDVTYERSPGKARETRALTFIYAPLYDEQGEIAGIFCEGFDVTGNRHAQVRQAALSQLADAVRDIADPDEIAYKATEILGRTLQVSRAGYGTIHLPTETIVIDRDWNAPGISSIAGVLKFRDYGSYIDDIKAGRTVIVSNADTDSRTAKTAASLKAINAHSFVNMPVTEQGDAVALLFLNHHEPREWQSEELDLIREFAERTRSAVARRSAEIALRESERRLTFLDKLSRATAPATDADTILSVTTRMVAEHLDLSNCAYADMDADEDGFTIRGDWAAPGSPTIVGHYSLTDFGTLAVQELSAGRPLNINDNLAELLPDEAQTFQDIGIAATICMPLVKEGRLTALMAIHDKVPRKWSDYDLALTEEVTERSWAHVERVRFEARLRESEERLRLAVDNAEIGFWDVDELNDHLVWPAQTKAMFGISADVPVTMQDFYDGLHPDDRGATAEAYAAAADPARRALYDVEYRTVGKEDGIVRWVAAMGRGVFEGDGREARCLRVAGTAIEITARKVAEERLRDLNDTPEKRVAEVLAERKTFADVVEGTDAFVQVADLQFRWLAINRAAADEFEQIYGVRPRVGDSMLDLLSKMPEHKAAVHAVWARALAGEAFTEIAEFGDPGRARRHYEMKYNPLRDARGELIGAYQFVYDVTERIAEQKRLADAEEALRHSQKMEAMGQLTGGVAHDFNNLLTPIVGSLDMLQRKSLGTEREQRLIAGAAQSADRAKTLVQRLLAFARRQPLQAVAVDVGKLVGGIADWFRAPLDRRSRSSSMSRATYLRPKPIPTNLKWRC
jgi:PAS domain S-box-containing protein